MSKQDYYQILGVSKASAKEDIKSAYRKLAIKYHPDKNPDNKESEEKFKEASHAYEILSDDQKRKQYDQLGHDNFQNMSNGGGGHQGHHNMDDIFENFGDIFGDIFGGGAKKKRKNTPAGPQPLRGHDLHKEISISLLDAFLGKKEEIKYYRFSPCKTCDNKGMQPNTSVKTCANCKGAGQINFQQGFFSFAQPCNHCSGQGFSIDKPCLSCKGQSRVQEYDKFSVNIPAGIYDGAELRISQKGDAGMFSGPSGDLFLKITVLANEKFKREKDDLICKVTLTYPQLVLGCHVEIENIDSIKETIKVPKGCPIGEKITISSKGFTSIKGKSRGSLIIITQCHIPKKLDSDAKELLEKYSEIIGTETNNENGSIISFFKKFLG